MGTVCFPSLTSSSNTFSDGEPYQTHSWIFCYTLNTYCSYNYLWVRVISVHLQSGSISCTEHIENGSQYHACSSCEFLTPFLWKMSRHRCHNVWSLSSCALHFHEHLEIVWRKSFCHKIRTEKFFLHESSCGCGERCCHESFFRMPHTCDALWSFQNDL